MSGENFNNWEQIGEAFCKATSQVVRKSAFDIQAGYQARAHRDTGFMANSAYTVTSDSSSYGSVQQPQKGQELLPEVERPQDDYTADVAIGANYAIIEESGGVHHPAHPALVPAVEYVRPGFDAALAKIEDKLREVSG